MKTLFATTTVERLVTCDPNSGARAFKEGSEDDESGFGLSTLCVNQPVTDSHHL